jgi:hypothetical protein
MRRLICATLAGLFLGGTIPVANPQTLQKSTKPSPAIDELLWWLPTDTETVQVTQRPSRTRGLPVEAISAPDGKVELGDVGYKETLERHLSNVRVKASLEGSRRFAAPSGLGGMLFEGANLFLLEKPFADDGKSLMGELQKQALKVDAIAEFTVVEFRDKLESDVWASYITVLRPDVLVIATNVDYLKELIARRKTRTGARALPPELEEWSLIDAASPFWAIRHYRRELDSLDPTSPFLKNAAASEFDDGAVGVVAHAAQDGRTIVVHYLSTGPKAEDVARKIWHRPGDGVVPAIRRVAAGAIEVRFSAKDEEDLSMFMYYLLAALGHATYL